MTWFEAKDHCEKEGGKLVEIDSAEENTALVEEINRRGYTNSKMHFWKQIRTGGNHALVVKDVFLNSLKLNQGMNNLSTLL